MESDQKDSWTDQLKEKANHREPGTTQQKDLERFIFERIKLIESNPSLLK
jgi:hypothetical protein